MRVMHYKLGGLSVVFLLMALVLPGVGASQEKSGSLLIESGRLDFIQYCSSCHGDDGKGVGPVTSALRTPPADLTEIRYRRNGSFPVEEVTKIIDGRKLVAAHGSRDMPVWGLRFGEKIVADSWHWLSI